MLWVKEKGKGYQKCQDQHILAHPVKYLLSTYCVPGSVSGKMDGVTTLLELMVSISTEIRKPTVDRVYQQWTETSHCNATTGCYQECEGTVTNRVAEGVRECLPVMSEFISLIYHHL